MRTQSALRRLCGGDYVPTADYIFRKNFPLLDLARVRTAGNLAEAADVVLSPFLRGSTLAEHAEKLCTAAFAFPAPVRAFELHKSELRLLELHHGPTAAFKDFGARFLATCLAGLLDDSSPTLTLLAATSGDTGGAIASAVTQSRHLKAIILFPKGGVSAFQERPLCCWPASVLSPCALRETSTRARRLRKWRFAILSYAAALH